MRPFQSIQLYVSSRFLYSNNFRTLGYFFHCCVFFSIAYNGLQIADDPILICSAFGGWPQFASSAPFSWLFVLFIFGLVLPAFGN